MTNAVAFGAKNWAVVLIVGLFGQIAWTIENMYFNIFVYHEISTNPDVIAAMVAASAIVATLTTLIMGAYSDHIRKRKIFIVVGYLLWGLSTMAFAWLNPKHLERIAPGLNAVRFAIVLVIVMDCIMTFFGSTANDAAFNAWVTDVTVPQNRGRVQGVLSVLPLLSMLIVFGALDPLTQEGRWDTFFIIIGAATLAAGLISVPLMKEPVITTEKTPLWPKIKYGFEKQVIKDNPKLYLSLLALLILSISTQIYMPYLIIYMQNYLKIDNYALVLAIVLIGASIASVIGGRLIDKFGKETIAKQAINVQMFGLLGMYFLRDLVAVTIAGLIMMSGFMVLLAAINGLIQDYLPQGMAGRFQGVRMIFAVMLPMIIGPFIGSLVIKNSNETYVDLGVVKQVPTPNIFLAAVIALFFIIVPFYVLNEMKKKENEKAEKMEEKKENEK
ncbi:MAG TPA: MFS transporter [Fastidiosipila sp.]|nr:MFS transporter [Fastidiosipila sp.]